MASNDVSYSCSSPQPKPKSSRGPSGQPLPPTLEPQPPSTLTETPLFEKLDGRQEYQSNCKIVIFGAAKVGKTSIVRYFVGEPQQQEMNQGFATHGPSQRNLFVKNKESGQTLKVDIWDTGSGNEEDLESSHVYENCGAAVLVFDVNDYETAKKARTLGNNIKGKTGNFPTKFLVVGNKKDEENCNSAIRTKAEAYAKRNGYPYFATSTKAMDDEIDYLFEAAVKTAFEAKEQFASRGCIIL
ncbi:uncharacterized protein [Dysidea avara]|uniref:uncharacterized protein isoform X2 n=1 Tax=Dysidea avara TaxID=196820 RepID=UPI0033321A7D